MLERPEGRSFFMRIFQGGYSREDVKGDGQGISKDWNLYKGCSVLYSRTF